MNPQVAQPGWFVGGQEAAVRAAAILHLALVSINNTHQLSAFVFAPAQPSDREAANIELQLDQKIVNFLAPEGATVAEYKRRERFSVTVGQPQNFIVRQIVSQHRLRSLCPGQHCVALLHTGAARATDQEMLLGGYLFELQNVVVIIGPDDDQVAEDVAAVLFHHIYDSLMHIPLHIEHKAAPFGMGHRWVLTVVNAGNGFQYGINNCGSFAGTDGTKDNDVCEKSPFVKCHSPQRYFQLSGRFAFSGYIPPVFDGKFGKNKGFKADGHQPHPGFSNQGNGLRKPEGRLGKSKTDHGSSNPGCGNCLCHVRRIFVLRHLGGQAFKGLAKHNLIIIQSNISW